MAEAEESLMGDFGLNNVTSASKPSFDQDLHANLMDTFI
jgi:hypothetical protein